MRLRPTCLPIVTSLALVAAACTRANPSAHAPDIPREGAVAVEGPSASVGKPTTPAPSELTTSCLMLRVCGCNLGCVKVDLAPSQVRAGARGTLLSGTQNGEPAVVVTQPDEAGGEVLVVTDTKHDFACARPSTKALFGYACATKNAGPVPLNACSKGCGDPP